MKAAAAGDYYLLRLDPGDEILDSVQRWCRDNQIYNALLIGIGSVENPTIAHYRRDTKKFTEKRLAGIYEVISLVGNVGLTDGNEPLVHLHITLSDEQMRPYGGHLVEGCCSATAEIVLRPMPTKHQKKFNEEIGLKIWDFSDEKSPS
jgi:predicted DNA-binding protein with PD1-like motif